MTTANGVSGQQIYDMLMQSQFWPAEQMLEFQRSQLSQLLHHAKAHVPFYKTRLDCVLRKDGSVDWDRWPEVPILTRADLRDHATAMRATVLPPGHGTVGTSSSSGSTGVPITVAHNSLMDLVSTNAWQRFYAQHGLDKNLVWADIRPLDPKRTPAKTEYETFNFPYSSQTIIGIDKTLSTPRKLELIRLLDVDVLNVGPANLEILAQQNLREKNRVRLKAIVGIGMGVSAEQRALFQESFGAPALSPYSSKEGSLMAFQCSHSPLHFHVNSELVYLEILDRQNQPCALGQKGRGIITSLFNTAQPIIRYDQGDEMMWGENHRCGIALPTLAGIEGRIDPIFRFPGNDMTLSALNYPLIQTSLRADAFQIAQTKPLNFEVRYVSVKTAELEAQDVVRQHLLVQFPVLVQIDFIRVSEIPANAGGKQQRLVREFDL